MLGPDVSDLPTSASSHPLDVVSIVTNLKIKLDFGQYVNINGLTLLNISTGNTVNS